MLVAKSLDCLAKLRTSGEYPFVKSRYSAPQRLLGLSIEDPTPPLDTPLTSGWDRSRHQVKFEGPKPIELEPLGTSGKLAHLKTGSPVTTFFSVL